MADNWRDRVKVHQAAEDAADLLLENGFYTSLEEVVPDEGLRNDPDFQSQFVRCAAQCWKCGCWLEPEWLNEGGSCKPGLCVQDQPYW